MIIHIYNRKYRLKENTAASAKKVVKQLFDHVRINSELYDIQDFFVAFVITIYIFSSSILRELDPERIKAIAEEIIEPDSPL